MASTATTRNALEKPGEYDYYQTWADVANAVFDAVDEGLDGTTSFTLSGTKTLTDTNYVANEARDRRLNITGGSGGTINLPAREKWYWVTNAATGDVTIQVTGAPGTTVTLQGDASYAEDAVIFCDGTNVTQFPIRDGWVKINSYSSTSGTTVDCALDRTYFKNFRIVFYGVSHSTAGATTFRVFPRGSGGTYPTAGTSAAPTGAQFLSGSLEILDQPVSTYYVGQFILAAGVDLDQSTLPLYQMTTNAVFAVRWAGDIVRFDFNGATFDGGTFEVWAR